MKQVIIFAGTTEGRLLSQALERQGISILACTATEYGGQLVEASAPLEEKKEGKADGAGSKGKESTLKVHAGRLNQEEMCALFQEEQPKLVVDATHPYAAVVSENIHSACDQTGVEYLRLIRQAEKLCGSDCVMVDNVKEAVEYLKQTKGNVLLTTGSKELKAFTEVPDYQERLYARVLSTPEVALSCSQLGFVGKHLICMQGPFSKDLNVAMLRQINARYLVTKESGKAGGFPEKLEAALEAGAKLILIGRPAEQPGKTPEEVLRILEERFSLKEPLCLEENISFPEEPSEGKAAAFPEEPSEGKAAAFPGEPSEGKAAVFLEEPSAPELMPRQVILAGIGMGVPENMTREVWEACCQADCIIGAKRMLESVKELKKPTYASYRTEEIKNYIEEHPEYKKIVLVLSGDVGFYSGAKGLLEALRGPQYEVQVLPGISSVVYFCSLLKTSWEDVKLCSAHGRSNNLIAAVREHKKVFTLLGGTDSVQALCRELKEYGLSKVRLTIGEQLHYPGERLVSGRPDELEKQEFAGLCVALMENPTAHEGILSCLDDEAFIRGKVPMTKSEVRSVSVAKLRLTRNAVIYDVGAGTGSVTIEMALQAGEGMVYAVEKKEEAAALIEENMRKFGTPNIRVIRGLAPEALEDLPRPTHVFIGGSSGNLKEILELILKKNPGVRIVMNAVTLETVSEMNQCLKELPFKETEITQLTVAKAKALGSYQLMMGQNPVYIVSCTGAEGEQV